MNAITEIMKYETAGDPVSGCKWTRKTTGKIARQLKRMGIGVSGNTVGRLLKKMDYSLRRNLKSLESGLRNPPVPHLRDRQFRYIRSQIQAYAAHGLPVISVDTKSRELIGAFHQPGRQWCQRAMPVFDHDFPSDAQGIAIPYGIYDFCRNEGFVNVGTSRDTAEFAVASIRTWWQMMGLENYPDADHLLILADCGGSNGYRTRLWKHQLQVAFADPFKLHVKVCHYPPGASKWNPIEHRMFSFISNNWAAHPLTDYETVLKFIRTTKTMAGLKIRAALHSKEYQKGIRICDKQMQSVTLKQHTQRPRWNYSISPGKNGN
ncbi:MAG: ISAzo13 family transposase [Chloroflexi bacterium]|nr:ISAzo13 family transposase [Chloroflexota bacterium]